MKYLVKYCDCYADEFTLEGMMLLTKEEYKEFVDYFETITKLLDSGREIEWYFGTNEYMYYRRGKDWEEAFRFEEITDFEAETLEGYVFPNQNWFGLMPDIEFMYNEIEDWKDEQNDEC